MNGRHLWSTSHCIHERIDESGLSVEYVQGTNPVFLWSTYRGRIQSFCGVRTGDESSLSVEYVQGTNPVFLWSTSHFIHERYEFSLSAEKSHCIYEHYESSLSVEHATLYS